VLAVAQVEFSKLGRVRKDQDGVPVLRPPVLSTLDDVVRLGASAAQGITCFMIPRDLVGTIDGGVWSRLVGALAASPVGSSILFRSSHGGHVGDERRLAWREKSRDFNLPISPG
jgi:hypothetical protein